MAKKMYRANKDFMFRIPTSGYLGVKTSEEELLKICKDKAFREKILIASPSLLQMIDTYFDKKDKLSNKKVKEMFVSIEKYFRRSIDRTTPFGLFAGVGIGSFGEKNSFKKNKQVFRKCVYPDAGWLWEYIAKFELFYHEQLRFKWNSVCIHDGNRDLLLYTTTQDIEEISVRRTPVLNIVKDMCKEYVPYTDIVDKVQEEYPDVEEGIITAYVYDLIQKQILISDFRPVISDKDPLNYLIQRSEGIDEAAADALRQIKDMCEEYEKTAIGEGNAKYQAIVRSMKELHKSKYYLQVDTNVHGMEVTLGEDVKEQLEQLAEALVMLSAGSQKQKEAMNSYRDKFVEKYGVNRLVPLTEMMDPAIGIGAPIGYLAPASEFFESIGNSVEIDNEIRNYFLKKYEYAMKHNTSIRIDMEELGKYLTFNDSLVAPVSFELYIKAMKENGKVKLYMSGSGGASCAGKTFGRFALKNQEFAQIVQELNEQEKHIRCNVKTCEISYLPARLRNGNVMRCPSGRDMVLSAYMGENPKKEGPDLQNILIGVENARFYAVNGKTKERIVFGMNNMYNLLLQPNIYRFLHEISNEGEVNCFDFPWKYIYQYFKHIPRIELGNIVLSKEQWFVSLEDLQLFGKKLNYEEFQKAFAQYRRENHLPDEVYLVEEDNKIVLHSDNEISLQILWDAMKRKGESSVLLECREEGENLFFEDTQYATEIVVPVFRSAIFPAGHTMADYQVLERKKRIVLPYDNWLYFKLYCKHERETELIALELRQFAEKLKEEKGIEHFFVRYIDTKPHIRVRFHARAQVLGEATPDIMKWISELGEKNIIGDVSINQYEREIERYGGSGLIDYAEALFRADSVIVETILQKIRMKQINMTVEEAAILSVIKYLEEFYKDFGQWLDFCTRYYHTNEYLSEFRENKDRYLAMFDVENNWSGLSETGDGKELLALLDSRKQIIKIYKEHIEKENTSEEFKDNIVASVLHLHCNRFIGTDREYERKIMSFVESLLYAKKHLYKERG